MNDEPVGTTVLFENDRVRVWEMVLDPGDTCAPHRHQHDYLMIYTTPSVIRATLDDGRPVAQHVEAGGVAYRAVGQAGLPPHQISNCGTETSRHFIVELLGANATQDPRALEHNGRGTTELLGTSDSPAYPVN